MSDNELVTLGVYGIKGNVRITTNVIDLMCHKSGYGEGVVPTEESTDLVSQIYNLFTQTQQDIDILKSKNTELETYISSRMTELEKSNTDISEKIGTPANQTVSRDIVDLSDKIDGVESGMYQNNLLIKTWIGASETNVGNKIETAKNSLSDSISTTGTYTNTIVNNARDNILGIIGLPANDTVSKDIADVKTTLSQDTADIKTTVTNSKTVIMDKLGSSDIPIDVQLVNMKADFVEGKYEVLTKVEKSKSELSDELKTLKEYIEDKHNETLDEMRKTKLEIIRNYRQITCAMI